MEPEVKEKTDNPEPEEVKNDIIEEKPEAKGENPSQEEDDQIIDPYTVQTTKPIDYNKLIEKFGCNPISPELISKIEALTKRPAHWLLKRGIFFSHRDLDLILNNYEKGKPFFLYTGRGPSSDAMHLGHLLPFIFTKYLQDAFKVPLVIQITDDEKFFHKGGADIENFSKLGIENIKDIIACGFDPALTFIFMDTEYIGHMYKNVCRFQKLLTYNQVKGLFGMTDSDNSGKVAYPAIQAAPSLSTSFPHIFGTKNVLCLIPQGIDQDPYFRMTRDICLKLKVPKPACIHSKFFPALQGLLTKMSSSSSNSAIFLTDSPKEIKNKINKYAFSGGGATVELHKLHGADLSVDIPYQYLTFFLEDDKRLEEIREKYGKGEMLTGEVKAELIKCLTDLVVTHQENRKKVTPDVIKKFMEIRDLGFK